MSGKSWLSKLATNLIKGSPEALLYAAFKPIRQHNAQIADDIQCFVLDGTKEQVLLSLSSLNIPDLAQNLNLSGAANGYYWHANSDESRKARAGLYTAYTNEEFSIESIVRLAKVMAEILSNNIEKHTYEEFPDYLHVLITDWLCISARNSYNPSKIRVPKLTREALGAFCQADDHAEAIWLFYYLDRKNASTYGVGNFVESLEKIKGVAELITENRDYFLQTVFPKMSAYGKTNALEALHHFKLVNQFQDLIIDQLVASSKSLRQTAEKYVKSIEKEAQLKKLRTYLFDGNANERKSSAEFIGRCFAGEGKGLLEEAAKKESSATVLSAITIALGAASMEQTPQQKNIDIPDYDKPDLDAIVSDECTELLYKKIVELQDKYRDKPCEDRWEKDYRKKIMALSRKEAKSVIDVMNGEKKNRDIWHEAHQFADTNALWDHPSVKLINVVRVQDTHNKRCRLSFGPLRAWLHCNKGQLQDFRQLQDVLQKLAWDKTAIDEEVLHSWDQSFLFTELPREGIWPYYASRISVLVDGLNEVASNAWDGINFERILDVIECFPEVPAQLRPGLLQLALGEGKRHRLRIQEILSSLPDIEDQVKLALSSNTQDARMNAARWLARIQSTGSIEHIKVALKKEKREVVRAALMSALESLGEDISELLTPEVLKKEADKGLGKKMPKSLSWFPFTALPTIRWNDNSVVDIAIAQWWVVLACKLNEPSGNDLLRRYLSRLDEKSRSELGLFVVRAFIEQDIRHPTMEEADAAAQQRAPQLLSHWKQWANHDWGKEYKNRTLQDAHRQIQQEVLSTYLGSAIKDKGILALCCYCPGAEAVPILNAYMKNHFIRRAQIESMLKALASGDDNNITQLLLSVARRYRTRSVQEVAKNLVEEIATRNGWSQDELADRTMPTAGFDNSGRLGLEYGSRQFLVQLDDNLKPVLRNETGKIIKSLPAARQDDDAEQIKEAKVQLKNCKKELKQVIELTTGRLYEAMCSNRRWTAADWTEYLFEHPVAIQLIQRLVWVYESDDTITLIRPTADGAILDVNDDEAEIPSQAQVYLAHRSTISEEQVTQWKDHLKDYKIKPLFDQLNRPRLAEDQDMNVTNLDTYKGYMSDAFTLRGSLSKLGYQRGQPEDGGFFYYYYKDFNSLGLKAVIQFSGNCVPEENVSAALHDMGICKLETQSWYFEGNFVPLKALPEILLSEVLADYQAVADKTAGFDEQWEKKIPW